MVATAIDFETATRAWTRNRSDELAVEGGCRFNPERGAYTVFWVERYCRLYEGDWAGQPMVLRGCHQCGDYGLPAAAEFDEWEGDAVEVAVERARRHNECFAARHPLDWQYECAMRIFGWERHSEKWNRFIRRFREAIIFIAKKGKKSPTLAALALYLWAGDGEQGQKVFLGAKDGTQARDIVGKHIFAMWEQSPELQAEATANMNLMQLTHQPTRSIIRPLSSSNSRTKESKEGLNGSFVIDETHVVDDDFIRRISRAGISRSEPLRLEGSTAGNNPDSYGKRRFDYAVAVEKGDVEDQAVFAAVYAAPQDVTDEELDADPVKYGRMANPAWGHTIDPEEFLNDYRTSKQKGIQDLLDFKMYRLDIWQRSANPWLRGGDWEKCRREFAEKDLLGRDCWAGLDLSRTRDMSALVLCFPWREDGPECYRFLPFFWLPRQRADEIARAVPQVLAWERSGFIELTPGGVTDYGFIKARFRALNKLFNIRELVYDPRFAEEVTQTLEQGQQDDKGVTIEEGTGVPRFVFDQNDANFAAPTEDYERLVVAGCLNHNGHPVQSWQAGHAQIYKRPMSGVKRVVKPKRGDVKTVDGVVAGVMALARAVQGNEAEWYTKGCLRQ